MLTVDGVEQLAREAHRGQFRRDGSTPYITHCEAIAEQVMDSELAEMVAWLHDVIEDTGITKHDLLEKGVPAEVVRIVGILTKVKGEDYENYLKRVASDKVATRIKILDMHHNLSCNPTQKQRDKYKRGLEFLCMFESL